MAQTKWDMPTPYPATNFHTENVAQFAADVDKATNGKLKITVHANASLFKAPEIKRAVQGGQAQIGEILISGYSNEDPVFGVDSVPFLASSYSDAAKLWKASRKALEERFAKQGMMVLYSVPWPPQGIYSSKPINSIADLKGMKMRTYNPYTSRIAELAGAQPVTIQAAELAQAFATGAVNANITSGATGYDTKAWEVVKNYYDTQAWLPKNVVFVNKQAFDALDKASQAAVMKAAAGFLALAHTLKRGEHIRVSLLLDRFGGRLRRPLDLWSHAAGTFFCAALALFSVRLAWNSRAFNDISQGNDATPLWIPQIA